MKVIVAAVGCRCGNSGVIAAAAGVNARQGRQQWGSVWQQRGSLRHIGDHRGHNKDHCRRSGITVGAAGGIVIEFIVMVSLHHNRPSQGQEWYGSTRT